MLGTTPASRVASAPLPRCTSCPSLAMPSSLSSSTRSKSSTRRPARRSHRAAGAAPTLEARTPTWCEHPAGTRDGTTPAALACHIWKKRTRRHEGRDDSCPLAWPTASCDRLTRRAPRAPHRPQPCDRHARAWSSPGSMGRHLRIPSSGSADRALHRVPPHLTSRCDALTGIVREVVLRPPFVAPTAAVSVHYHSATRACWPHHIRLALGRASIYARLSSLATGPCLASAIVLRRPAPHAAPRRPGAASYPVPNRLSNVLYDVL